MQRLRQISLRETAPRGMPMLYALILICFAALFIRLTSLQIIHGHTYKELSERNRIRVVHLKSPRGDIVDRYGRPVASDRYAFNLCVVPAEAEEISQVLNRLSQRLELDIEAFQSRLRRASPYVPVLIKRDINRADVAWIEENSLDLPGVVLEVQPTRAYPYGSAAAHILGYLGEVSESQLKLANDSGLRPGDLIGQAGIEKTYDRFLRGIDGKAYAEVDAHGRELRRLRQQWPQPGDTLVLSLDWDLQLLAEELLEGKTGAIVVLDPRNGDVLAMASHPAYDPNSFARGLSRAEWEALRLDLQNPLQNRAIQGQYPPGSTYKIITATASMEEGIINPSTTFKCNGALFFGRRPYRCWKHSGHGTVDLHHALVYSCDVFFYNVGTKIDIDALARYARGYGLGRATGIPSGVEARGIVPTKAWKLKTTGEPWYPGENLSSAIGQGYNLVTPLQMANLISAVANGGILYQPKLVKRIEDPSGEVVDLYSPKIIGRVPAQPSTLETIRKALYGVVNEPHGTGWRAKLEEVAVAGKTGTAQVVHIGHSSGDKEEPESYRDHAWFIAFAPFEEPQIAMSVFIEHAGEGGSQYAPIAKQIIEKYFNVASVQRSQTHLLSRRTHEGF